MSDTSDERQESPAETEAPAALAVKEPPKPAELPRTDNLSVLQLGRAMQLSGYFPDIQSQAQAVVKILAGRELGLSPVASMTGIHIVQGRVTLSSHVIAALVRSSERYDYRIARLDNEGCIIVFLQKRDDAWEECGKSVFTIADARMAGLFKKPDMPWNTYPRNMLFSRAITNGARWYCPDVFWSPTLERDEAEAIPRDGKEAVPTDAVEHPHTTATVVQNAVETTQEQ